MNRFKTYILMALLTALLVWVGHMLGGREGAILALIFAGVMNFSVYWFSDRIILKMYRAKEATEAEEPGLYRIVRELALRGGLPMPKVYVIPNDAPNAFATGRNPHHAAVAVTREATPMRISRVRSTGMPSCWACSSSSCMTFSR